MILNVRMFLFPVFRNLKSLMVDFTTTNVSRVCVVLALNWYDSGAFRSCYTFVTAVTRTTALPTSICDKGTKKSRRGGELQTAGGAAPNSDRQCAHASMKVGRFHSLFFSVRQIWICDVVFIRRSMNYRTTSTAPAALLTIFQIKAVSTT